MAARSAGRVAGKVAFITGRRVAGRATRCGWPRRAPTSSRSTSAPARDRRRTRWRRRGPRGDRQAVEELDRRIVTREADVRDLGRAAVRGRRRRGRARAPRHRLRQRGHPRIGPPRDLRGDLAGDDRRQPDRRLEDRQGGDPAASSSGGGGSIVLTSSTAGLIAFPNLGPLRRGQARRHRPDAHARGRARRRTGSGSTRCTPPPSTRR